MIIYGIIIKGNIYYNCGRCGYYLGSDDTAIEWKEWNFCPFCGEPLYVKMKREMIK